MTKWEAAWQEHYGGPPPRRRRMRPAGTALRPGTLAVLIATVLAVGLTSIAPAGIGDALREGVRNPRSGDATRETMIIANHGDAATRQSNKGSGLAAVYGCRREQAECTRHVNLKKGPAAAFATKGNVPFTVGDATGKVPNLNADRLDGMNAADIVQAARGAPTGAGKTLVLAVEGQPLRATVLRLVDPVPPGEHESPNGRFVGVEIEISNQGDKAITTWPSAESKLITTDNRQHTEGVPKNCYFGSTQLAPGDVRRGCVGFDIPADATPKMFQFSPAIEGFGNWQL